MRKSDGAISALYKVDLTDVDLRRLLALRQLHQQLCAETRSSLCGHVAVEKFHGHECRHRFQDAIRLLESQQFRERHDKLQDHKPHRQEHRVHELFLHHYCE